MVFMIKRENSLKNPINCIIELIQPLRLLRIISKYTFFGR